jgi:formylglycine-generating enzyme required for sulfatase activity
MIDEKDPKNGEPRRIDRTAVVLALIAAVVSIAGGYLTYRAAVEPILTEMKIHATETASASEQQETAIPSQQTSVPTSAGQSSTPEPLPSIEPTATVAASSSVIITEPFHMELVRVPAGPFFMGSDPERDPSAPEKGAIERLHRVPNVPEFLIGKYEVTNSQYAVFVKATSREAPSNWNNNPSAPAGQENHPVTYVDWTDAVQFSQWLRGQTGLPFRLCTEAEWEKACRGALDPRMLPWGDKITLCIQQIVQ